MMRVLKGREIEKITHFVCVADNKVRCAKQ